MQQQPLARPAREQFRSTPRPVTPSAVYATASRSAGETNLRGGDLVEALVRPDGSTSVLVADLSSKGPQSIGHVEALRDAFRAVARETRSPAFILSSLNELRFDVANDPYHIVFASAIVTNFEQPASTFCYASAGHEPALFVRGRSHRHLQPTGPLIGVMRDSDYFDLTQPFGAGDLLVFATDGFSECRNVALESMQFGTTGIIRALNFDTTRSCRSASSIVASSADIFSGGIYRDDATIAVIARNQGRR